MSDKHLNHFKSDGISYLSNLTKIQLGKLLNYCKDKYYNEDPVLTDSQYDIMENYIGNKYPDLLSIGAEPHQKSKVFLPYPMPSLNKIKPDTNALQKWCVRYSDSSYCVSAKLDGISALYVCNNGKESLYTRGNGSIGHDISHIIPFVKPGPVVGNVVIRGELIMSKNTFANFSNKSAHSRNLVSGIVNSKTGKSMGASFNNIDFVAYELFEPKLKPKEQFSFLTNSKFKVVKHKIFDKITNDSLSNVLLDWRKNYEYLIDGIVVSDNNIYTRVNKNPDHAFAFKMVFTDNVVEATVVDVVYSVSKNGLLKPRVQIEPINIDGTTITWISGIHAKNIKENKIGIGAIVLVCLGGGVIPHILKTITPAENPKMPDINYKWNDTQVDAIIIEENDEMLCKNITGFFTNLQVEGLSIGNIKRIMGAGFNSIPTIVAMNTSDFLKIEGFQEKMANKLYNSINKKLEQATLPKIMAASNIFGRGFGEKKFIALLNKYPCILTTYNNVDIDVEGFGQITIDSFLDNVDNFVKFLHEINMEHKITYDVVVSNSSSDKLKNQKFVFTGFRDKNLEEKISNHGGTVVSSISKTTTALIIKDKETTGSKVNKAKELKIDIVTIDQFESYFS